MFVYTVSYNAMCEGSELLGIFTDYVKARQFELEYRTTTPLDDDNGFENIEIRKIELDKIYGRFYDVGVTL